MRVNGRLGHLVDAAFSEGGPIGVTQALVVVQQGRLVFERYGGALEFFDRPAEQVTSSTPLLGWSMAKSVLHAIVGMVCDEGLVRTTDRALAPQWDAPQDPRRQITVEHLLAMRDGLAFAEEYQDAGTSDVIEMLFGSGQDDVAAFAADRPLATAPGAAFHYSSGTSNVLSGLMARILGPGQPYRAFLHERLFGPLGMTSATPGMDAAGTWVASSNLHATARDFARFGLLYLRDGIWEDRRLLPPGWVDHGRRPRSIDPEDGMVHGAHWWAVDDRWGSFRAAGFEGQAIVVVPGLDLVLVRLGKTPEEHKDGLVQWRSDMVAALAECVSARRPR